LTQLIAFAIDIPKKLFPFYRWLFNSISRCQTSVTSQSKKGSGA